MILGCAEQAATTLHLTRSDPGGVLEIEATLMLIPIILGTGAPADVPRALPPGPAWDRVVQGFHTHGFLDAAHSLVLHNALLRIEDLPTTWPAVRQWLTLLADQWRSGGSVLSRALPSEASPESDNLSVYARFLVEAVSQPMILPRCGTGATRPCGPLPRWPGATTPGRRPSWTWPRPTRTSPPPPSATLPCGRPVSRPDPLCGIPPRRA